MFNEISTKKFVTVKQAADLYPAFNESSFRWFIFNEHQNDFQSCVIRVGRKVLIDLDMFETWLENQRGGNHE